MDRACSEDRSEKNIRKEKLYGYEERRVGVFGRDRRSLRKHDRRVYLGVVYARDPNGYRCFFGECKCSSGYSGDTADGIKRN